MKIFGLFFSMIFPFVPVMYTEGISSDTTKPVISGPVKIIKNTNTVLTSKDILTYMTAFDTNDGNLTNELIISADTYSGYANKVGDYYLSFKSSDYSNNVTYYTLPIIVNENSIMNGVIYLEYENEYHLVCPGTISLSHNQIIKILQIAGKISSGLAVDVIILSDNYTSKSEYEGSYELVYNIRANDGTDQDIAVIIDVTTSTSNSDLVVTVDPKNHWYDTILNFLKKIISYIWKFITWLFPFLK